MCFNARRDSGCFTAGSEDINQNDFLHQLAGQYEEVLLRREWVCVCVCVNKKQIWAKIPLLVLVDSGHTCKSRVCRSFGGDREGFNS